MMIDDAQRHQDATRDDPPGGASREEWIKSRLQTYLRNPILYRLHSKEETATGRGLSQMFTDLLDIRLFLAIGDLDELQQKIIVLQCGNADMTIDEVAQRVKRDRATVYRRRHYALEYLARVYYDEPDYVLPWRNQPHDEARGQIAEHLRDLGV
jgi:hypothetical protein